MANVLPNLHGHAKCTRLANVDGSSRKLRQSAKYFEGNFCSVAIGLELSGHCIPGALSGEQMSCDHPQLLGRQAASRQVDA